MVGLSGYARNERCRPFRKTSAALTRPTTPFVHRCTWPAQPARFAEHFSAEIPGPLRKERDAMTDPFEDHCWKDIMTPDVLEIYSSYRRNVFVGPNAALLAVDLYELVYRGGDRPPAQLAKAYPSSCGEYAYAAIEPTKQLFAAARGAGLPIFYSTADVRAESRPSL